MWKIVLSGIVGGFLGFFVCAWLTAGAMADLRSETGAYARLLREFVAAYADKNLLGIMGVYHDACKILHR